MARKKKVVATELTVAEGPDYKIIFDRETGDYRVEWCGRVVGYRANRSEARLLVEQLRYEALTRD
jgi:hypothetical protein